MPVRQHFKNLKSRVLKSLFGKIAGLIGDKRGAVFVYVAVSLPVIIGFAGLGVDISMWQLQKRRAQDMADGAAMAAGVSVLRTGAFGSITAAATEGAVDNGFSAAAGGVIVVNNPPVFGPLAGNADIIEVMVTTPAPTFFSAILTNTQRTVSARAATLAIDEPGDLCMISLDPGGAIRVGGTASVGLDCGAYANGDVDLGGDACLTATQVQYVGDGDDNDCSTEMTHNIPRPDPLRFLQEVDDRRCDANSPTIVTNNETVDVYAADFDGMFFFCRDVVVNQGGTLILHPGIYVFDNANFSVSGTLDASAGVMLYFTENASASDALQFAGTSTVTLNAMWSQDLGASPPVPNHSMNMPPLPDEDCWQGTGGIPPPARTVTNCGPGAEAQINIYEGIAVFLDRDAPDGIDFNFGGGAEMVITGVVYLPGGDVNWFGGSSGAAAAVVADSITVTGNSDFGTIEGTILEALLAYTVVRMAE